MTMLLLVIELMYFITGTVRRCKDNLLTKIFVCVIAGLILVTGIIAYNFVRKPVTPYLLNGGATLWDTQTEELSDEICTDCETDEEKVKAIYRWMIASFEYDYDYHAFIQYFDIRRTLRTHKGVCYDFSNLFAALCRSQGILCYVVDGKPYDHSLAAHTWNRVYYNGSWWDVDVTNDTTANQNNEKPYGFRKLESSHSPDGNYIITRIY